jgi:hypothetical protein
VAKVPASPGQYPGVKPELLRLDPDRDNQEQVPVRVPLTPQPGGSETRPNAKGVDGTQSSGARPNSKLLEGDRFAVLAFQQGAGQDQAETSEPDSAAFRFTLTKCPSGDVDCRARRDAYSRLGRWAVEINKACQGTATAEPDWTTAAGELDRLVFTLGGATEEPLAAAAAAAKGIREPVTLCATARRLLELAR